MCISGKELTERKSAMYNETDHAGRYAGQVRIRYGYNRIGVISNMQEDKRIDPGLQGNEKREAAISAVVSSRNLLSTHWLMH